MNSELNFDLIITVWIPPSADAKVIQMTVAVV